MSSFDDIRLPGRREAVADAPRGVLKSKERWPEAAPSPVIGSQISKQAIKRSQATQWGKAPWVLGGFAAAAPGGQPGWRVLMEPFRDRLFFAGEAVHETQ